MTKTKPPIQGPDFRATAKIDLHFPIEVCGVKVDHLIMRRPKARDKILYGETPGNDDRKAMALFAHLTETPVEDLMELDEIDLDQLLNQYLAFKGARPQQPNSAEQSSSSAS